MGQQPHTEILAGGREQSTSAAVSQWLRANPRLTAALTVVALVTAALVVMRSLREPEPPTLAIEGIAGSSPVADPWQSGWDGRPRDPVMLSVTASVRRQRPGPGLLTVSGIVGPGVVQTVSSPVAVPDRGTVTVPLSADVDCSRVPLTVPTDAFGLRITTREGKHEHTDVVPAGDPGRGWAHAVQMACATWTARRDLTVSTLRARVQRTLPGADLTVTFVNSGLRTVVVQPPESAFPDVVVKGAFPIKVPPLSSVTAHLTLELNRCDVVGSVVYSAIGAPTVSSRINMVALAGPAPEGEPSFDVLGDGTRPTGVVLAPAAGKALGAALTEACGDLGPVVSQIAPGGIRYERATRDLSVTVRIGVTPGRVRTLSLQPNTAQPQNGLIAMPAWTTTREQRVDAAGHARLTVHYRAPSTGPCPTLGATLLGAVATLRVPAATGERVLRYSLFLDMAQDTQAVDKLCGDHVPAA